MDAESPMPVLEETNGEKTMIMHVVGPPLPKDTSKKKNVVVNLSNC